MITKCTLRESTYEKTKRNLFVENYDFLCKDIKITTDDVSIKVNANELIKAIEICKNS
jgi:hypothetical protein